MLVRIYDGLCALAALLSSQLALMGAFVSVMAESGGKEPDAFAAVLFLLNLAQCGLVALCAGFLAALGGYWRLRLSCTLWLLLQGVLVFHCTDSIRSSGLLIVISSQAAVLLLGVALQRHAEPPRAPEHTAAD